MKIYSKKSNPDLSKLVVAMRVIQIIGWGLVFLSFKIVCAQIPATTQDGKKVLLYPNGYWQYANSPKQWLEYLPQIHPHDILLHHTAYALVYDTIHHLAKWTIYQISINQIEQKNSKRTNRFLPDPLLYNATNLEVDYKNSGYDRGHLVPAADMAYSDMTMQESFYYSNITPQVPSFNRGIWKRLEEKVREWVLQNHTLIVVSGAIITDTMPKIGIHSISVPHYFYKIVADLTTPDLKMIGFIIPNAASKIPLSTYAVSVDSIEKITHINFFSALDDAIEETLEKEFNIQKWFSD